MPPASWTLTDGELAAALAGHRIAVSPASPLAPPAAAGGAGAPLPKALDRELLRALRAVAAPRAEIGLLVSPPFDGDFVWYYQGGEAPADTLAGYRRGPAGEHHFLRTTG